MRKHNKSETQCFKTLSKEGWQLTKRGWPDFFCIHPEKGIMAVEVKPAFTHPLKKSQQNVMRELVKFGVPCFRWDPNNGLTRYADTLEASNLRGKSWMLKDGKPVATKARLPASQSLCPA